MEYNGMVITDLDGTLLKNDKNFCDRDVNTLHLLEENGFCRTIATGRSLYSLKKIVPDDFPVDYIVFSSGAGIMDWNTRDIICKQNLIQSEYQLAIEVLKNLKLDFMLHYPVPANHHFRYFKSDQPSYDFLHRIEIYKDFALEGWDGFSPEMEACQLIAITGNAAIYQVIKDRLPYLKVIRTTSPLDHSSTWIEIFHPSVSKGFATIWLCHYLNIPIKETLGIGNDYNDIDLLLETYHSYVVSNAPHDLKVLFKETDSNDDNGFTKAVYHAFQIGNLLT